MTDARDALHEKIRRLPMAPGCYLMKDKNGRIFYVGKAQNLRARVRSYFNGSDTRQFVAWLDTLLHDLEVVLVSSDKEAILLERTLVRQHKPRFNVLLQDDKNFIHLRLDPRCPDDGKPRQRYPRLRVVRGPKSDGARYFGPYHSATSVRASLRVVNRYFQLRTCTDAVLENRVRPCLQYQIGRCPAPCVGEVPDYKERVQEAALFLEGRRDELIERLESRMWDAADNERFELAAQIRNQLEAVQRSLDDQVVTDVARRRDQDVISAVRSGALLEIARLEVRKGALRSSDRFSFEDQEFPTEELLASFLGQLYGDKDGDLIPDEILVEPAIEDADGALGLLLSERRGKRVEVRAPQRGRLRRLMDIARKNAEMNMSERLRQLSVREGSLDALQKRLKLPRRPSVIECYDVSLFQGAEPVASCVCFVDGAPEKSRYRRFNIKTVEGTDDFAMLYEALTRRLRRAQRDNDLPDLFLIDGGKGQLKVAVAACRDLGIDTSPTGLMLASVAKARTRRDGDRADDGEDRALDEAEVARSAERIFLPHAKDPIPLRPHTQERYLVERIRDEAHRFAITAHRARRKRRTLTSALDDIPGVGPKKRRALLKALGSVKGIKAAPTSALADVPGIGPALAKKIHSALAETN